MKFKLTTTYNYYTDVDNTVSICKFYKVNHIPFAFDTLPKISQDDPAIIALAEISHRYDSKDIFRFSNYLVLEEVHPLLFELELENPELLPVD